MTCIHVTLCCIIPISCNLSLNTILHFQFPCHFRISRRMNVLLNSGSIYCSHVHEKWCWPARLTTSIFVFPEFISSPSRFISYQMKEPRTHTVRNVMHYTLLLSFDDYWVDLYWNSLYIEVMAKDCGPLMAALDLSCKYYVALWTLYKYFKWFQKNELCSQNRGLCLAGLGALVTSGDEYWEIYFGREGTLHLGQINLQYKITTLAQCLTWEIPKVIYKELWDDHMSVRQASLEVLFKHHQPLLF